MNPRFLLSAGLGLACLLASPAMAQTSDGNLSPAEALPISAAATETTPESAAQTEIPPASAAEPETPPAPAVTETSSDDEWQFSLEPILWLPTTTTNITVRDRTKTSTVSAADALPDLNFAAMGRFAAQRGDWGAFLDLAYVNLSSTTNPSPRFPAFAVNTQASNLQYQLAGTYRVLDNPGEGEKRGSNMDFVFGLRGYALDVDVNTTPIGFRPARSATKSVSWVDPIVGAKGTFGLSPSLAGYLYGDLGGLGMGSQFTWRAGAGIDYELNETVSLDVGYAAIYYDYQSGSGADFFRYETTEYGPVVGLNFKL